MSDDVTNIIDQPNLLREQAKRYRECADRLDEAADILDGRPSRRWGNRMVELRAWLSAHGPSTRKEIIEGTGMPTATIGYLLKRENGFTSDADFAGRWSVSEVGTAEQPTPMVIAKTG
jgi:hypothetical protein